MDGPMTFQNLIFQKACCLKLTPNIGSKYEKNFCNTPFFLKNPREVLCIYICLLDVRKTPKLQMDFFETIESLPFLQNLFQALPMGVNIPKTLLTTKIRQT